MMIMRKHSIISAMALIGALAWVMPAMGYMGDMAPAGEDQTSPAVPMISGGIGEDEIARLHSLQSQYNLKLLFTEGNGMFLSDVQVHITDRRGNDVADTVTNGPILLVKLPAGEYKVEAVSNGESHQQRIAVGRGLRTYQFRYTTRDTE